MNVLGYARVSTDDQGRNGYGLDAQRSAIRAECDRRGWTLLRIEERRLISARTREGLAVARKRGVKLGRPVTALSTEALQRARALRDAGLTFAAIADDLNASPHRSALGKL